MKYKPCRNRKLKFKQKKCLNKIDEKAEIEATDENISTDNTPGEVPTDPKIGSLTSLTTIYHRRHQVHEGKMA